MLPTPPTLPTPSTDRSQLERCMAQMADGDDSAVFTFADLFGDQVERKVRAVAGELGRLDLLADADDLNAIVLDACLAIYDKASGWDPGGAPPWVWAWGAIRQVVVGHAGHRVVADEIAADERQADGEGIEGHLSSGPQPAVDVTPDSWDALVQRHQVLQLLDEALRQGTARNRWVFVEFLTQLGSGDPSPAATVGDIFNITAGNVRQIVFRQRKRLRHKAATDATYAPLLELAVMDS